MGMGSGNQLGSGLGGSAGPGDADQHELVAVDRKLPEGVSFAGMESLFESREAEIFGRMGQSEQRRLSTEQTQMIFCYPDGTTSTARFALANTGGRAMVVELRGLTGVVTLGETVAAEELLP
jgi:hypothetical protein